MEDRYSIRSVETLTGVRQDLIRTWERRYGAVSPGRTATNRRRYSSSDVAKLKLIRAALDAGHSIGAIAALDLDALRRLTGPRPTAMPAPGHNTDAVEPGQVVDRCIEAARALDAGALDRLLGSAATDLGATRFAERVVVPLLERVGAEWRTGDLHPAQEHLVTEALRGRLSRLIATNLAEDDAPVAIVATPRGQSHEMGAMLAALAAACAGWSVKYLGASLPAEEIAWAARASGARAVLISIVYPPDDPRVAAEIAELRRAVGPATAVAVGGRAAPAYARALEESGAELCTDIGALRDLLDRWRA